MYKIVSNLTQIACDAKGPVLDEDGKQTFTPVSCLIGAFRWPAGGVIVPDDFFADDRTFVAMVKNHGIDVFIGDGESWTLLEAEDEDEAAGASPSGRPAPSSDAVQRAAAMGVRVTQPLVERTKERGPQNEEPPSKVRSHIEAITTPEKGRRRKGRRRKGRQQAMND